MSKVLNFGSINIDETFEVPHLCLKGETLSSVGYTIRGGGKGRHTASNTQWRVFTPTTYSVDIFLIYYYRLKSIGRIGKGIASTFRCTSFFPHDMTHFLAL
jgi:hypothetical protein